MSADLRCRTCLGKRCPDCWSEYNYHESCTPCPDCIDGQRPPTVKEWDALKAERDALREVHTAAWEIIWALSPHAHHTLSIEGARIALKAACEKAQAARAALDSEGGEKS